MKTLLIASLLAGSVFAAPIFSITTNQGAFELSNDPTVTTFSAFGAVTAAPGGFLLSLNNPTGPANDTAIFVSGSPLTSFGAYWDNLPSGVGTGVRVFADNVFVGQFGVGVLQQGFWGFTSTETFSSIKMETNNPFSGFLQEHVLALQLEGGSADSVKTPEPGTLGLLSLGLIGVGLYRRRRQGKRIKTERGN